MTDGGRPLMVVDDDPTMLMICRRFFEQRAPAIPLVEAASGEQAIETLRRQDVRLVLSDYRMGRVTGTDVLAFALETRPHAVRILMSGFGDPNMVLAARQRAKIHGFIEKPIDIDELEAALQAHVLEAHLADAQEATP